MSSVQLKTHLQALYDAAAAHPDAPIIRTPILDAQDALVAWRSVSFTQFVADVEHVAKYWAATLSRDGIPSRSVIGLWSNGLSYVDVLHIYGLARAGYIPQLFTLRLPNPAVIYELLALAGGKALVYSPHLAEIVQDPPVRALPSIDVRELDLADAPLPPLPVPASASDISMIFHTSGSTSGRPKLLPCSYAWLDTIVKKAAELGRPIRSDEQDVVTAIGSMCHIGETFMFLSAFQNGACTIQPTRIDFPPSELLHMVTYARLNRLTQFPAFLAHHFRAARGGDKKVLGALKGLDEIFYSGQPMPREDEQWAYANDLQLRNVYGMTEAGAMMASRIGGGAPDPALRPLPGTAYAFQPIESDTDSEEYGNAHGQMLELVILGSSGDCPDPSARSADGHYHTGDLFIEVAPGEYVCRGRNDDWIKTENCLRCDTRAIEDNARSCCGNIIAECVVVGSGRPSPALFVEPVDATADPEALKKEIIRKTRGFHSRRYLHERITSAKMIVIVPRGTLPRTATKGNVRRRAVEDMFKAELDAMFAVRA